MSLNSSFIVCYRTEAVPRRTWNRRLYERAHFRALSRLEEKTGGADELERVPLDRIVTRGNHQSTRRVQIFHRELAGRCRS